MATHFEMRDVVTCKAATFFTNPARAALIFTNTGGANAEIYMPAPVAQRMAQVWADAKHAGEV